MEVLMKLGKLSYFEAVKNINRIRFFSCDTISSGDNYRLLKNVLPKVSLKKVED
jgi:hypothetical protein